jgi:hypothetical protein
MSFETFSRNYLRFCRLARQYSSAPKLYSVSRKRVIWGGKHESVNLHCFITLYRKEKNLTPENLPRLYQMFVKQTEEHTKYLELLHPAKLSPPAAVFGLLGTMAAINQMIDINRKLAS